MLLHGCCICMGEDLRSPKDGGSFRALESAWHLHGICLKSGQIQDRFRTDSVQVLEPAAIRQEPEGTKPRQQKILLSGICQIWEETMSED